MSRPVFEPSLPRTDAELGYGSRQLFRRPSPVGDSVVPWCRLGLGGGTAVHNTWTNAGFTQAMLYNTVPGDVFTLDDTGSRFRLILEADGLYIIDMLVSWTNTFAEPRALRAQLTTGDWLYDEGQAMTASSPDLSTGTTPDYSPFAAIDKFHTFAWVSESVSTKTFDPQVWQLSGVNKSFDALSFRAMYFGPMGAEADWTFETT